jgi:uncharacterized protein with HEPN domain
MRSDRLLLQDMLDSIVEVMDTTPVLRADYDSNKFVRSHVLRHVQIIGEAAWKLSGSLKDQNPHVPWKKIAGMRHVLVHDYFEVNWIRVYETARHDVPALKPQIESILASIPP